MSELLTDENVVAHTPGPWEVGDTARTELMVYCDDALGSRVADCSGSGHGINIAQDRANARLIATAPELLAALKLVCDTYGFDPSIDSAIWQTAFAAVAKAEGRSHG